MAFRRAAKVDANQGGIVKALRDYGASVLIISQLKNCFDILVGYNGREFIMEIKDGDKPPSQRKLSEGEQRFKDNWKGSEYHIVLNKEQALKIINE